MKDSLVDVSNIYDFCTQECVCSKKKDEQFSATYCNELIVKQVLNQYYKTTIPIKFEKRVKNIFLFDQKSTSDSDISTYALNICQQEVS